MSASVLEAALTALVTALNTGRPAGLPVIERDRWVDLEAQVAMPVIALSGYEDEPKGNQNEDRLIDFRTVKANFEIYVAATSGVSASQAVDAAAQWISKQCGPVDSTGALAGTGAIRVVLMKKMAIVGKGNVARCLVELGIEYRNLVNDVTRAK